MDILIFLFAIAALVWMIPVIQSGRLIVIAMLVLVVGTVFGPSFFAIDGPIQLSIDRLLWFAVFGLAILGCRLGYTKFPQLTRLDWLVVGIVGWFLVSALRGGPVPPGSSPVARWLFYIVMPAGMYVIARIVELRGRDVRLMVIGSMCLSLYLAVTAIFEISGLHAFVFPKFIVDGKVWEFFGRGRGPLLNPSGNGVVMSIGFASALISYIYAERRKKLLYAAISVMILVGIYATLTRSAWMGAACVIAIVALVHSPRWVRVLGLVSVVFLGGIIVSGAKDQLIRLKRDKNLTAADAEKSVKLRPLLAIIAFEMFKDQPIIGHGYGHYFGNNASYHSDRTYNLPLEQARSYAQHNVLLSVLVDTGLIGLSLFVSWLVMLLGIGWRLARQTALQSETRWVGLLFLGTTLSYLCNGMFQDVMIIPMVHMFLFFLAGVLVNVYQRGLATASESARQPAPWAAEQILAPAQGNG